MMKIRGDNDGDDENQPGKEAASKLWLPPQGYPHDPGASIKTGLAVVVSIAVLLSMLMSVVAWGLKLEGQKDADAVRIANLEQDLAVMVESHKSGIHNVTAAEIAALKARVRRLELEKDTGD